MTPAFMGKLRQVHWRCSLNVLLRQCGSTALATGAVATVLVAVERLLSLGWANSIVWTSLAGAAVVGALVLWLLRRPSLMRSAILMDERLATRERFSSALFFGGGDDPFERAAVAEIELASRRVDPHGQFPLRLTRRWGWAGGVWACFAGAFLFMPNMDLLKILQREREAQQQARQAEKVKQDVRQAVAQVQAAVKQVGDPKLSADLAELEKLQDVLKPPDLQREVIRRLSDISERMRELQKNEQAEASKELTELLHQLRSTPGAVSQELNQALARGDFDKAQRELEKLRRQLQQDKMTDEQRKQLAKQLKDLARQLEKLAQGENKSLKEALKEAGLDQKLANATPEQIKDAAEKLGLTQEQVKSLLERAAACKQAQAKCQQLGQKLSDAGAGCESGDRQSSEAELADLEQQLSEMAGVKERERQAQATMEEIERMIEELGGSECEDGTCSKCGKCRRAGQGEWAAGDPRGQGPGRGYGPRGTDPDGPASFDKTGVKNQENPGPPIASWYFKGEQVKGESTKELTGVVQAAKDQAAEAMKDNQIPRQYQDSVKKYFSDMETATRPAGK